MDISVAVYLELEVQKQGQVLFRVRRRGGYRYKASLLKLWKELGEYRGYEEGRKGLGY